MENAPAPDFQKIFEATPGLYLVLQPDLTIIAVNDAYAKATLTQRVRILGKGLFDIFPDNPDDATATGVSNLRASLLTALREKRPHAMDIQQYDIRRSDGSFEERHWRPLNTPVLNEQGEVLYLLHRVEDVTAMIKLQQEQLRQQQQLKDSKQMTAQLRALSEHLQDVREEERAHIAREIHDELGQQMTAMKMDISWVLKKIAAMDETVLQRLGGLTLLVDDTIKSVRRIAAELRPSLLDDLGLIAAIEWQLHEFEKRSGILTKFGKPAGEPSIAESFKTSLFRIVQESLTNVSRHAQAHHVQVSIEENDHTLMLSIKDDGIGFEKSKVLSHKTFGLMGMKERSAMMGGSYAIDSIPKKGTTVTVTVPLPVDA